MINNTCTDNLTIDCSSDQISHFYMFFINFYNLFCLIIDIVFCYDHNDVNVFVE